MHSLRTQLSLVIAFVVLITVALTGFLSNFFISRQFEAYLADRQQARAQNIAENIEPYYNGLTDEWDLASVHALSMYSLYDGYILSVYDDKGDVVWETENHDMETCHLIMSEISERMAAHGKSGEFALRSYDLMQNGRKIGSATLRYYGPFFLSESDFSFLFALNAILIGIGALSLAFSFVIGRFPAQRIARPIRKTADIARQIAAGRYDVRFESRTKTPELQDLVSAINHLASALAAQERLRKQLTADVAHELRTPLATLGSHLEAMTEGLWEPTPARLKACHEEILRLGSIVADLERLERAENDERKPEKTPLHLRALVEAVCDNFAGQLAAKNLRLETAGADAVVSADRDKLGGVLHNLLSNAIKYTPEGGEIRVIIEDAADAGILAVEDNGPGIPAHELPYVFERFYRADKSRNRNTGGAGIGLAIVKSVVAAHGGSVTAENRADGGCRFTVKLPKDTP
ncbi:MAG: HAMP domain-containing protein [Clostridiales Family XIII bacterium]|jgi:signal transduction histidine kinase|nr:HAMP domain-containing protein [Clostridiales Family XIII bacterium]